MFDALPKPLNSAVPFLIVLGVLVFFHELGHYLAARWRGVHVETFSIGFGRSLGSWKDRHGTQWKLAWIPLGGYVKLHGQERPEDVAPDVRAAWMPGRTFHEKSVLSRAIVVAAGPVANFILAAVLFASLFAVMGEPVLPSVIPPEIGQVMAGSAAEKAGLQTGDVVEAIGGEAVASFEDIKRIVSAHPAESLKLQFKRGGASQTVDLTTDSRTDGDHKIGVLGVTDHVKAEYRPVSLSVAFADGVVRTWDVTEQTVSGLWQIVTGKAGADALGGPLGIAKLSGQAAEQGVGTLINFIAVLSVNLGLINLFPIPVLDGGHLVFFFFEAVRGRPLPPRAQEYGFRAGLAVLAALFVFATWNDLSHFGLVHWVQSLIG